MYHTEPPTDKAIREWYVNFSRVAACALRNEQVVRAHGPGRHVWVCLEQNLAETPHSRLSHTHQPLIILL